MIKNLFVIAVIASLSILKLEAKNIPGQIVFDKDTVNVTFKIPVNLIYQEPKIELLQDRVNYIDSTGKVKTLKPDQAKEFWFGYKSYIIRMQSVPNIFGLESATPVNPGIFLVVEMEGKVKLFDYYYKAPSLYFPVMGYAAFPHTHLAVNFMLEKNNGMFTVPIRLTFKKDMEGYFSDCPALGGKIEDNTFKYNDLHDIVKFYNTNCGKQDD